MKLKKYTFTFKGGKISVMAFNETEARILAQAEAINRGWDYEIIDHLTNLNELLYVVRTNMTSITRYVRHERKDHPALTEGQFIDQHLKYKELAEVAVQNILEYVNGTPKERGGEKCKQ